jgi:ribosomal protein S18 acetylase RimI-like enzyme
MSVAIRRARPGDAERLRTIAREAYANYVPRIGREPAPMSAEYAAAVAAGHAIVIEQDETVAGYLIGYPANGAYLIENVAVDPAHQGRGLGGALLRSAIDEAKRRKLSNVWLFTNAAMTENLALYAHLGFVETHRTLEHGFNRVYMRLAL